MKNPAPQIRTVLFSLMNGNLTSDGSNVPVYEGLGIGERFVVIGGYADTDQSNKNNRQMQATQDIEIVDIKLGPASRQVDELSEQVMNLIHPTLDSDLWGTTDFQIYVVGGPSMLLIREMSADGQQVVRRVLRYNLLIDELT